jgi:beta-phosphoglucomutase
MESLEIVLERAEKRYTEEQRLAFATTKNSYYLELITKITPADILPGVRKFLDFLAERGIKTAIGSSSKNTPAILQRIGLSDAFGAISDGNNIKNSKPDPEVFLKAADMLKMPYGDCLVIEDADAGIDAGLNAGMDVLGVGFASKNLNATYTADSLNSEEIYKIFE